MANKKISELDPAGTLTGSELVEIVQSGGNVRTTTQAIADLGGGGGGSSLVIEEVSATTYEFVSADNGKLKIFTGATGCTANVPTGLPDDWCVSCYIEQSAGDVTVTTDDTYEGTTNTAAENASFSLFKKDDGTIVGLFGPVPSTGATNLGASLSSSNVIITSDTGTDATIPSVDGTNAGVMTPTQKSKLDGIASGATANSSDAALLARVNHTGTQVASTISDFNAAALAAAPAETTTTEGALINGATAKTTPVDADFIGLMDSAASNVLKKLSWANIKATLKTYFDTLYPALAGSRVIQLAASDETTAITAGVGKITFRMPYGMTLTEVRASLSTAQASGSIFTVDINKNGASILSTKITIDNTEKTSTTAATAAVISDTALVDDAEITIDVDQIGNGTAKALKIGLIGY